MRAESVQKRLLPPAEHLPLPTQNTQPKAALLGEDAEMVEGSSFFKTK